MPTRQEVYQIIDSERDYQESIWGNTASGNRDGDGSRSEDEFALYISGYADELVKQASTFADAESKQALVRKIAGLCVASMEQHGAPERQQVSPEQAAARLAQRQ